MLRTSSALPKFKVLAGLRWSYIENMPTINTKFLTNTKTTVNNTATSDQALSPKVGLIYMPNDNLSVFATYTNSFVSNAGYVLTEGIENLNTSGTAQDIQTRINNLPKQGIKPTTVDQYEIGARKISGIMPLL
jgi:iron complex outermembrane receptor protein